MPPLWDPGIRHRVTSTNLSIAPGTAGHQIVVSPAGFTAMLSYGLYVHNLLVVSLDSDLDSRVANSYFPPPMSNKTGLRGMSTFAAVPLIWGMAVWAIPAHCADPSGLSGQMSADPPADPGQIGDLPHTAADGPGDSVLLLRNGGCSRGGLPACEDRYIVEVPGGGISVRAGDVQQHCRDVAEAYGVKRALTRLDAAQDHIELAQWCQKIGLPQHAAEELAEAKAIEPSHPMLPLVERQLRVAAQSKEQTAAPAKPAVTGPSVPDLDRMVRAMPPKTVETFTQVIQPMLVSHCASAACHGPGSQSRLQLLRPPAGKPAVAAPDAAEPVFRAGVGGPGRPGEEPAADRPYPASRHRPGPDFTNNQTAIYGQLLDWCCRVSRAQGPVIHASYEQPVSGGRNEPGRPVRARAAMRAQRNQERDATKATRQAAGAQAFPPFSATAGRRDTAGRPFPLTAARTGPRSSSGAPDRKRPGAGPPRPALTSRYSGGLRPPDRSGQP